MNADPRTILTPLQIRILRDFGKVPDSDRFFLSGASALAGFYLSHRLSQDLDLFTAHLPLVRTVSRTLFGTLESAGLQVDVTRSFESFVEAVVRHAGEETRVQLVQDTPFRLEPLSLRYEGVMVDTLTDLAANKLLALYGRAEPRDFVDVYLLITMRHFTMDRLFELAKQKDPGLDAYPLAAAFQKAADFPAQIEKLPVTLLTPVDAGALKQFFADHAQAMLRKGLSGS